MRAFHLTAAIAVVCSIVACSASSTAPSSGTVSGTLTSSLGGAIANATVTVTPTGQAALPPVQSTANGSYSVSSVPGGGGTIAVTNVPANCTAPAAKGYSGVNGNTVSVDIPVTCAATGRLNGTITSSATNAGIDGVTVTVTPSGAAALPGVTTNASGQYTVSNIPAGNGTIALSNLPTGCTTPSPASFGVGGGQTAVVNINVTCSASSATTTTLNIGESALFTDSPQLNTNLVMPANSLFLMTIVNTDSSPSSLEDLRLAGSLSATASRIPANRLASVAAPRAGTPPVRLHRIAAAHAAPRPLSRQLGQYQKEVAAHIKKMQADELRTRRLGNPLAAMRAARAQGARSFSLAATAVGDVNPVNVPVPDCDNFTTIGARTVYAGQHVQILADTSLTNWPQQYRPDSSYYTTLGLEYDTLTYNKHLLTYIGDPLQYDADLSSIGKVTVLLTPTLNNVPGMQGAEILAFVTGCDFFPNSGANSIPSSNETEMIYHLVPDQNNSVAFWEREIRPTLAHESKHIVSIGYHLVNGQFGEEVWLEEALAQVSSEVWGRNYNTATWRGNSGFLETLGCEVSGDGDPCSTATSPLTFTDSHLAFLYSYLAEMDNVTGQNNTDQSHATLDNDVAGRYGAGWSLARWAIDNYARGSGPSGEANIIKAMITNTNQFGIANVSAITGASVPQIFTYWSLAVALDTTTLVDSATFEPAISDPKTTVPSFNFRNIYGSGFYGHAYALQPFGLPAGNFQVPLTGVPGTQQLYILLEAPVGGGTQSLQVLSGSGGTISTSSGFRVGIIRVQ